MASTKTQKGERVSPKRTEILEKHDTDIHKNSNGFKYLFKYLTVGNSGVGKTALLGRFAEDKFTANFISTIGIDFKIRTIELDGVCIKLQIWDTAGQERFKSITTAYYRGAMGIFLVYDVTNKKSFDDINEWIKNIEANSDKNPVLMLVGNKCDMSSRVISTETGQKFAQLHCMDFIETSAKIDLNVNDAFLLMTSKVKDQLEGTISKPSQPLKLNIDDKRGKCC